MNVNAVFATETGHVVGALALHGMPGSAPAVETMVGEELPIPVTLRENRQRVEVPLPASRLTAAAVETTAETGGVLARPLRYGVRPGAAAPVLEGLQRWPRGADPVAVTADGVTVTLSDPAPAPTRVLVVLRAESGTVVTLPVREIPSGQRALTLRAGLDSGGYAVLTLVAGWEGRLDDKSVR